MFSLCCIGCDVGCSLRFIDYLLILSVESHAYVPLSPCLSLGQSPCVYVGCLASRLLIPGPSPQTTHCLAECWLVGGGGLASHTQTHGRASPPLQARCAGPMVSAGAQTIDPWQGVGAPCLGSQRAGVLAFLCFGAVGCESLGPSGRGGDPDLSRTLGPVLCWDWSRSLLGLVP